MPTNVRCYPNTDQIADMPRMTLSAISGLMHRSKQHLYSITSSALICNVDGTVKKRKTASRWPRWTVLS